MFKACDKNNKPVLIEEANKSEQYFCPICGHNVYIVNSTKVARHFSHFPKSKTREQSKCVDSWSYDMSEWHKNWQYSFGVDNIEKVVLFNNEKHRADVLIGNIVIEFQHSPISIKKFRERNNFYTNSGYKVIWLFDFESYFKLGYIRGPKQSRYSYNHSYDCGYFDNLFYNLDLFNEKALIFFEDHKNIIHKIINHSEKFSEMETLYKTFTKDDFIKNILNKDEKFLRKPEYFPPAPEIIGSGKPIEYYWSNNTKYLIVQNLYTKRSYFVYQKNYELTYDFKTTELRGVLAQYNSDTKKYVPDKRGFLTIKNSRNRIWKLIKNVPFSKEELDKRDIYLKEKKEREERLNDQRRKQYEEACRQAQKQYEEEQRRIEQEELRQRKYREYIKEQKRIEALKYKTLNVIEIENQKEKIILYNKHFNYYFLLINEEYNEGRKKYKLCKYDIENNKILDDEIIINESYKYNAKDWEIEE